MSVPGLFMEKSMSFKSWIAVAAMVLSAQAASASVVTVNQTPVAPLAPPFSTVQNHAAGAFADVIQFHMNEGTLDSSANSLDLVLGGTVVYAISGLHYELWRESASGGGLFGYFQGDNTTHSMHLDTGDYYLLVQGTATGVAGGAYAISLTTAPVPEPVTYGMLVAGLALLAGTARRTKQNKFH
jgi:hypothetical protein